MLLRDLRFALRMARRGPVFTAVAVGSLAIAIGANATVFTLLNALVLRPLPIRNPEQLVAIRALNRKGDVSAFSYPAYEAFATAQNVFSDFFTIDAGGMYNVEANGVLFADTASHVSGDFYRTLGVAPLIGRPITPEDDGANGHPPQAVAVISYRLWRDYYGSDPHVLGKTVKVEDKPFVIVGVNRPEFHGMDVGASDSVITPIHGWLVQFPKSTGLKPQYTNYEMYGRLRAGVTIERVRAQFAALWPRIRATAFALDTAEDRDWGPQSIKVESGASGKSYLRERYRRALWVLMAAVAVLLLIACVNLANLLLARSAARNRETAIRLSLGARPWTVVSQALVESVILALAGAAAGVGLAAWASRAIAAFLWHGFVPLDLDLTPDLRVLAFASGIAILTGIIFGLAPALAAMRQDPATALQHGSRIHGSAANRFGRVLIVAQASLSIALLAGAALFARSLLNLRSIPLGFRADHLVSAQLMPQSHARKDTDRPKYYRELLRQAQTIPGIAAVGASAWKPIETFNWKQRVSTPGAPSLEVEHNEIAPGFFTTLGMQVLQGRPIDDTDTLGRPPVAVVSASLARHLYPAGNAVGRRLIVDPSTADQKEARIVGVVNDVRLHNIRQPSRDAVYLALYQNKNIGWPSLEARFYGTPDDVIPRLKRTIKSLGKEFALRIETVDTELDNALVQDRLLGYFAAFFAIVALLLAALGLYGLLSYSIARRVPEIGVRMALGARPQQVTAMVVGESIRLVLWGAGLGIAASLWLSSLLGAFLYEVSPRDPLAMIAAALALLLVAIAASWLPARRAARTDPLTALRTE